jgi:hypothetical protein
MVQNKNKNNLAEYLTTEKLEDGEHSQAQIEGNKLEQDEKNNKEYSICTRLLYKFVLLDNQYY